MSEDRREAGSGRPWLRAWLVVALAAWAQVGVVLVDWAQRRGLVEDIAFSPYHLVGYAALLVLTVYVAWASFRALRRDGWRRAFPPLYGVLGAAFVLLVGWIVLDVVWRNTMGINPGVESALAPTRLLIPAALALLAVGPLRAAIAERIRPGLASGELRVRWAGVVAAALVGGAVSLVAFNPVRDPLNDWSVNRGVDASEIWTMAADGTDQRRVLAASGDGMDYSLPAWSPDGTRIAYTLWSNTDRSPQNLRNEDQTAEIWTMAPDGSDRRIVVTDPAGQLWIPAWSPDGKWIAYTFSPVAPAPASAAGPQPNLAPGQVGPPTSSAGASIWVVHPDGTGATRVTADGVDALGLVWAPDGAHVAFAVETGGGATDIHVATLADGRLADDRAIAPDAANDWSPSWSPDGTRVAFTSDRTGIDEIWIASIDGGAPTQLESTGTGDRVPVFSPDGTRIAFTSDRTGEPEVWSVAADGSDPQNLSNHFAANDGQWSITWSPDGSRLAYGTSSFQYASSSGWVRENLASAQAILFAIELAVVALLIVALGAPLGSFTLALTIVTAIAALPGEDWRFIPGAILAGMLTDALVRAVRARRRARVAAATLPALANLAIGLTIGYGGTLAWSITLLLGVTVVSALVGWGLAEAVDRLLQRASPEAEAPAG